MRCSPTRFPPSTLQILVVDSHSPQSHTSYYALKEQSSVPRIWPFASDRCFITRFSKRIVMVFIFQFCLTRFSVSKLRQTTCDAIKRIQIYKSGEPTFIVKVSWQWSSSGVLISLFSWHIFLYVLDKYVRYLRIIDETKFREVDWNMRWVEIILINHSNQQTRFEYNRVWQATWNYLCNFRKENNLIASIFELVQFPK